MILTCISIVTIATMNNLVCGTLVNPQWVPKSDVYIPGDVNIGVLAGSSYRSCKRQVQSRIQALYALKYRLDEINNNQSVLPNIKLGLVWLDSCWALDVSILKGIKLMPHAQCFNDCCSEPVASAKDPNQRGCYNVIGFIAPWQDDEVIPISRLASMYKIPHISIGATNDILSDRTQFGYFMRLNPANSLQVKVIVDTIVHFNWTYVSVIGDYTDYSRDLVDFFKKYVKEKGICIAFFDEIGSYFKDEDYEVLARRMAVHKKARTVALLTGTTEGGHFLGAIEKLELHNDFVFMTTDRRTYRKSRPRAVNNFGVSYSTEGASDITYNFDAVYKKLSPWNYFNDPFAEKPRGLAPLGCSTDLPKGHNESCLTHYQTWADIPNHIMYDHYLAFVDVINIFTEGLHTLFSRDCPLAFSDKSLLKGCIDGSEYLKILYNVTFDGLSGLIKFDPNGDGIIDYTMQQLQFKNDNETETDTVVIGRWTYDEQKIEVYSEKIQWHELDMNRKPVRIDQPESVCAKECKSGEFYIQGELKCCWECRKCRSNEIVRNDSLGCEICPILTWPEQENFTECVDITPSYMIWSDPIAICIEVCSIIGFCSCLAMSYLMIKYRSHKMIKGSSVEQMITILIAICLCYITTILLIIKPGFYLCYIEYCTYHLSCSFIFIPLFLKTIRLYRIFRAAERCQQEIRYVSSQALMVFSLVMIIGQVALLCLSMILYPIGDTRQMPVLTEPFVELVCINSLHNLLIPLCYNLFILMMCLMFGFLTRKLPDNFNESWYIFLSVATTLFIWIAFLPTYFMAFYAYHKGALLALALILNAVVTSICLFAPKVYAVYFIPENELKISNFDASKRTVGAAKT